MMKRYILTLAAASALVLAGAVSAGEQLTSAQMDGVTAGGTSYSTAAAFAYGQVATTLNNSAIQINVPVAFPGEYGAIAGIASSATGQSGAATDVAAAGSSSSVATFGTQPSDVTSATNAIVVTMPGATDANGDAYPNPFVYASSTNTGQAASQIVGVPASSGGSVVSAGVLGGTTLPGATAQ
jgi:hypothetical protein